MNGRHSGSCSGAGAPSGEFVEITQYAHFADLDGGSPMAAVLGADAAANVNSKGAPLATTKEVIVRRRLPDLSF